MSLSINPSATVYTQGFGSASLSALGIIPISAQNPPASTNVQGPSGPLKLGQMWIDVPNSSIYFLAGLNAFDGSISAEWEKITSATGTVDTLTGNSGIATPLAGNINVLGIANQINTIGSAGQLTIGLTNGVSIGSFEPVTPPTGGLAMPGQLLVGTSTIDTNALGVFSGDFPHTLEIIGTVTKNDTGNNQFGIYSNQVFAPLAGSGFSSGMFLTPTFQIPTAQVTSFASGLLISPNFSSNTGTISNAIGIYVPPGVASTGTVTFAYGGYFSQPSYGASSVALYADNMTIGAPAITAPNDGLNLAGSNSKILINTATPSTASAGFATLGASGEATINTGNVTANSLIFLTYYDPLPSGLTSIGTLTVGTVTPGFGFNVFSTNPDDRSVICYWFIN